MFSCRLSLLALALFGACDSKITSTIDADLLSRVETVQDCFPGLYSRAQSVLDLAETWRLNNGASIPDPAGLTFAEQGDGSVLISYVVGGSTIAMTVRFYSPTGVVQDLALGSPATLNDLIETASTELRTAFGADDTFVVGNWTISGGGISGSGGLTGVVTGTGTPVRLRELRTTSATPTSGLPPAADSSVTDNGPPVCTLSFATNSLRTDEQPGQQFPIGVINLTIVGPEATVTGAITFDGTSTANIAIDDIPGSFDYDVDARTLNYLR